MHEDGRWVPKASSLDLVFSDGGAEPFVTMHRDGDDSVALGWPTDLPTPEVDGATLTYKDALPGGDLVVTALSTGFTHSIVLRERPEVGEHVEIPIPVELDGTHMAETAAGGLKVTSPDDQPVQAPQPLMWDAIEDRSGLPQTTHPVDVQVEIASPAANADATMTLTPDAAVLADPATEYPVTIDPTFTIPSTWYDTFITNNGSYTDAVTANAWDGFRTGTQTSGANFARSFIKFPAISQTALDTWDIQSAFLQARVVSSLSCTNGTTLAFPITEDWTVGGTAANKLTWSNQPSTDTSYIGPQQYTPYGGPTGSACAAHGWYSWNVTPGVKNWRTDGDFRGRQYGFLLKAATEAANGSYREYRSRDATPTDSTYHPKLVINYMLAPAVPTALAVSPSRGSVTRTRIPTLSADLSDGDGGSVTGEFHVYDSDGNEVWTGTATTTSPGTATVSVPDDILEFNQSYTFRVRALDGTHESAYSPPKAFDVNPSASIVPAPPCTSTLCHQLSPTISLLPATILAAGETRTVDVAIPVGDTSMIDSIQLTASAWNASADGSLTVSSADDDEPQAPTLSFVAGAPSPGTSTSVEAYTSYDTNQIKVSNNSSGAVSVTLLAYVWTEVTPPDESDDIPADELDASEPIEDDGDQVDDGTDVVLGSDRMAYLAAPAAALAETPPIESAIPCPNGSGYGPSDTCTVVVQSNVAPSTADLDVLAQSTEDGQSGAMQTMAAAATPNCANLGVPNKFVLRGRYLGCRNALTSAVNYSPQREPIGGFVMWIREKVQLHWNSTAIDHSYKEIYVSGWGTGEEVSNDHKLKCTPCDLDAEAWRSSVPYAINKLVRETQWDTTTRSVSVPPNTTVMVKVGVQQRTFAGGQLIPQDFYSSYDQIRCDNWYYLQVGSPGCVFKKYIPTLTMSKSGSAPQTARHIYYSQLQRTPRLPGLARRYGGTGSPLTRKFWFGATNRNTTVKDRKCRNLPRPTGYQCDEYPFASTNQGCYVDCDVRMIPGLDNGRGGIILNQDLYRKRRVLNGDAFWVHIVP